VWCYTFFFHRRITCNSSHAPTGSRTIYIYIYIERERERERERFLVCCFLFMSTSTSMKNKMVSGQSCIHIYSYHFLTFYSTPTPTPTVYLFISCIRSIPSGDRLALILFILLPSLYTHTPILRGNIIYPPAFLLDGILLSNTARLHRFNAYIHVCDDDDRINKYRLRILRGAPSCRMYATPCQTQGQEKPR
jgi:hypothetical protein